MILQDFEDSNEQVTFIGVGHSHGGENVFLIYASPDAVYFSCSYSYAPRTDISDTWVLLGTTVTRLWIRSNGLAKCIPLATIPLPAIQRAFASLPNAHFVWI